MKRIGILSLSALAAMGLTSFSDISLAQEKLVKDQLVGTWTLVSCAGANNGMPPFCVNPNGLIMMDASGRYMLVIAARGRPKFTGTGNRTEQKAEEYKAAAQGLVAQFGTWSFDETDQILTAHVEAALFPNAEGTDGKVSVSLVDDELRVVAENGGVNLWRRAK